MSDSLLQVLLKLKDIEMYHSLKYIMHRAIYFRNVSHSAVRSAKGGRLFCASWSSLTLT